MKSLEECQKTGSMSRFVIESRWLDQLSLDYEKTSAIPSLYGKDLKLVKTTKFICEAIGETKPI